MEWASLSVFNMRGMQGIWEFPLERNCSDNSSVLTLTSSPVQPELPFQSGVSEPVGFINIKNLDGHTRMTVINLT